MKKELELCKVTAQSKIIKAKAAQTPNKSGESMTSLTLEQKIPTDIEVDPKQSEVRINWTDGYKSTYSLDYLRKICPCATCNEQRSNQDPLRVLKPDQMLTKGELRANNPVEMVGKYALQFFWADDHSTGIYTFEFLRQQSP